MVGFSSYFFFFRILHILSGVFWVGSALFFAFFLEPTINKLGPDAGPMMRELVDKRKAPIWITLAATLTVIGGLFLYWGAWHENGSFGDWIGTPAGRVITVGAVCAIIAYVAGLVVVAPGVNKLGALGKQVAASGGPPSPEQGAQMHKIQERLKLVGRIDSVLLIIAVLAMATAREWGGGI